MVKAYDRTAVSVSQSHEAIRQLLKAKEVEAVRLTSFPAMAVLEFVRRDSASGLHIPYRIEVKPALDRFQSVDKAERQIWRVVYWWLKSKFEAIDHGLLEFEEEMLPFIAVQIRGQSGSIKDAILPSIRKGLPPPEPFTGIQPLPPGGR